MTIINATTPIVMDTCLPVGAAAGQTGVASLTWFPTLVALTGYLRTARTLQIVYPQLALI